MTGKPQLDHLTPRIIKLFKEHKSGLVVAKRLGCSVNHVYVILRRFNIPRRPRRTSCPKLQ